MALPSSPRVVVTGAGSGLGRAFCVELAKRNARIVASDIALEGVRETVSMLAGAEAHVVQCDVSKPDQVEALAEDAFRLLGGVDLVINNAGVAVSGQVGEIPLQDWDWIMGINLWGVIYGCHSFLPRMKKQGSGYVLNVASAAGLLCAPTMAPYNVTKAGVVALSETLRADLREHHIGVTVLCPTFFQTNIGKSGRGDASMQPLVEQLMKQGKLQANEVARFALDCCDRDQLYATPHADGRWMWRIKRLAPGMFNDLVPKAIAFQTKKMMEAVAKRARA